MLERLVPSFVACAESSEGEFELHLFETERRSLGCAVDKRRREFVAGRACARLALAQLGLPEVAIPSGPRGEPLWPEGVVGSITHCLGYRACAVARARDAITLGIDAEPNLALPEGVPLEEVAHGRELELVRDGATARIGDRDLELPRLLFSAKEAVYKAWFPLTHRWLGFEDVELSIDLATGGFVAALLVPGPVVSGAPLAAFEGRWALEDGVLCTAVVMPAAGS